MNQLDSAFGTLRALMQKATLSDKSSLLTWLIDIEATDPDRYHTQWVPYLAGFSHHWAESLATVDTIDALEHMVRVAPFAWFTFDGSAWTGLKRHAISQGKIPPNGYPPGFLNAYGFNDQKMAELVETPALKRVIHLNLVWGNLTHEGVAMLAQCAWLTDLKALELRYHYNITDEGLHALIQSPYITQLEHLDVSQTSSSAASFIALTQSPFAQNLKELAFWNNVNQTSIAEAFDTSTTLTQLTKLSLSDASNQDICDIFNSPHTSTLQTFKFDAVDPMTPDHIRQISKSPYTKALHTLSLSSLGIADAHLKSLAESQSLRSLHTLDLSTNLITNKGLQHLARAPWLGQITSLDLSHNPLGPNAFDGLIATSFRPTHLALNQPWDNPDPHLDETLARWLVTPNSANLQHLELRCATLSSSLQALAESTHITQLTTLKLLVATVDPSSLLALIRSPVLQTIQDLNLSGIWEDEATTTALCQALKDITPPPKITHLNMDDLYFTDEALIILSQAPLLSTVTHLKITGDMFSNDALYQFASSPYLTNLIELEIDLEDDYVDSPTMSEQRTILYQAPAISDTFRASLDPKNHLEDVW